MADRYHSRMTPEAWRTALGELSFACNAAASAEQAGQLRVLCRLLACAPRGARPDGLAAPDPARFEALLATGAYETAAARLVGPRGSYMVSGGGSGRFLASVIVPGGAGESMAPGASMALALAGAITLVLLAPAEELRCGAGMTGARDRAACAKPH